MVIIVEYIYLAYNASMAALLLLIIAEAHLFCGWFALSTQISLPFALMIGRVYVTDEAKSACLMAAELSKA